MELLKKEFRKAQSQSQSEDFTRPCTCSFFVTYRLPCRHFFAHCLQQEVSVFDDTLIDGRWAPLPPATTSSSQASVNVVTIQHNFSTAQQRFKLSSARCNVLASILAELPASRFPRALEWLDQLERSARSGTWGQDLPSTSAQPSTSVDPSTGHSSTSQPSSDATATQSSTSAASRTSQPSTSQPASHPLSSQPSSSLHYPLPVSQRGRPVKRKQRLFDAANRLLPFEKLRPSRRDYVRLSWLVDSDVANAALKNGYIIVVSLLVYTVCGYIIISHC